MKIVAVVVGAALATLPLSAQGVGWHGGFVVAKESGQQTIGFGFFGGVSGDFRVLGDERDNIRTGVFYVQKGAAPDGPFSGTRSDCCILHYVEVPVLYKFRLDEISYALVGPAASYLFSLWDSGAAGRRLDLGAVAGLGIEVRRSERLAVMFEAAFNYGLLDTAGHSVGAGDAANRAVTVGVRLQK